MERQQLSFIKILDLLVKYWVIIVFVLGLLFSWFSVLLKIGKIDEIVDKQNKFMEIQNEMNQRLSRIEGAVGIKAISKE
jgi:hypothetical protein